MEAMEKLRLSGPDLPSTQPGLYPALPSSSPQLCPLHQQVLELYCCHEKLSVCEECSLLGHKGHQVVRPDEERQKIQVRVPLHVGDLTKPAIHSSYFTPNL